MAGNRIIQKLIIMTFSVTIVLTNPVNNVTENATEGSQSLQGSSLTSSTPSTPSTPSPTCRRSGDFHGVPQLVFPSCTSSTSPGSLRNVVINGMACTCDINTHDVQKRSDYQYTIGVGTHKLHTTGAPFNKARQICSEEGGHLAIIESPAEAQVLHELFQRSRPMRNVTKEDQAFIGIHDLFAEGEWVTILGDSLHKYEYGEWSDRWGGQPDNGGGVQHCGTLLKEGGMDDVNCNLPFAFFCEMPSIRLAH